MKLVIVESPTKSKTIAHYLGNDYVVEASKGHVKDLAISGKGGLGVDVENNFEPKYVISKDKTKIVSELRKIAKKSDEVILATDPDREGEAIAYSLAKVLGLDVNTTKRLEFHEITNNSILEAISNPRTIDMSLVHAQETRRIIDRIMGFKLSGLLNQKIKSKSAGRVQSAALKLIVDHEKEIEDFKPEKYYVLEVSIEIDNKIYPLALVKYKNEKLDNFKNKDEALEALNSLNEKLVLDKIEEKERFIKSKEPFRTSTMQQSAFSSCGFSTKETTFLAQELYEGVETNEGLVGLITYIRTDSTKLSDTFIESAKNYIISKYGEEYYKGQGTLKEVKNAQDAHEAIRPTSLERTPELMKKYLSNNAYKLYKLIYNRTLASLMSDKKVLSKTYYFVDNDCTFKLTDSETLFKGYDILKVDEKAADEGLLSNISTNSLLKEKESYKVASKELKEDETKPPARYSEGKLVNLMEEKGIGRPSTYASTIATLKARKYITSTKGVITPTEQGKLTSKVLDKYFPNLINTQYTADMENLLDEIQNGIADEKKVIADFYYPFIEEFNEVKEKMYKEPPKETGEVCPKCGSPLVERYGKYGKFIACSNYPNCKYIKKEEKEPLKEVGRACPNCGSPLVYRKNKKGSTFIGCSNYPKCKYTESVNEKNEK